MKEDTQHPAGGWSPREYVYYLNNVHALSHHHLGLLIISDLETVCSKAHSPGFLLYGIGIKTWATETIGELSHTLVWGCLEGMRDSESCISLASWVLERDQMGIIIMVGDMHSVPQERTGYQDSSASPFTGWGDSRKQQETARKWVGDQTANQDAFKQGTGLAPTTYRAHATLGDRVEHMFHLAQLRHQGNEIFIYHPLFEGYFWAVLHSGSQVTGAGYWESGISQAGTYKLQELRGTGGVLSMQCQTTC